MRYCPSCGQQTPSSSFCTNCGSKLEPEVGVAKSKKKKTKIIFVAAIATLLVVSAGLAFGLANNNSSKELFWKAVAQEWQNYFEPFKAIFGENVELAQRTAVEPYSNKISIAANADDLVPELKDAALVLTGDIDPKKTMGSYSAALLLKGVELIKLELFQSNEQTALRIPLWRDDYFFFDNDKFGELLQKFDTDFDSAASFPTLGAFFANNNKSRGNLWAPYGAKIKASIKDKQFTVENNVSFQGKKCKRITLTLSETEVKDIILDLLSQASEDEELLSVFDAIPMDTDQGIDIRTTLKFVLAAIQQQVKQAISFPNGFKCVVVVDGDRILSNNIELVVGVEGDNVKFEYAATGIENNQTWEKDRTFTFKHGQSEFGLNWKSKAAPERVETEISVFSEAELVVSIKLDTAIAEGTRRTDFDLILDNSWDRYGASGILTYNIDQNLKRGYSNRDLLLDLKLLSQNGAGSKEETKFGLEIKSALEFRDDLVFPELKPSTAINLVDLSSAELEKIFDELIGSIESLFRQ